MTTESSKKVYYTIGEVADILGIAVSNVRYWANTFRVIKPTRNQKGNRLFSPKDLENFKMIKFLIEDEGMTLRGAEEKLAAYHASKETPQMKPMEKDLETFADVTRRLTTIRNYLVDLEKML